MSALGLKVADRSALPCRSRCPLCSGTRLTIYEDTISGGAWHYCFDCRSKGDMIELAAKAWKTSPAAAFLKLTDHGLPIPAHATHDAINTYVASYPQYRKKVRDLAENASEYLRTRVSPVLNALRARFHLTGNVSPDRWKDGPGRMFGGYPAIEVERVFSPGSIEGNKCSSRNRIFAGGKWRDVLTVPYFDLPERICGLLFVGRNGNKEDFVYKVVAQRPLNDIWRSGDQEGGLACLWAGNEPNTSLGRYAVVVPDALLALRLQVRHFSSARRPLPLVAFRDGHKARTQAAYRALDKTPVFWNWRLTAPLLNQAIASDGRVFLTELRDISPSKIDHYLRDNEPLPLTRRIIQKALPWREHLIEWAAEKEDGVIEALFAALDGYGVDRSVYANLCPRLRGLAERHDPTRKVKISTRQEVIERGGEWWLRDRHGEVKLFNGVIRVDGTRIAESRVNEDGQIVLYCGRIITPDRECPFEYTNTTIADRGLAFLQKAVTRAGSPHILHCPMGCAKMLLRVAIMFKDAGVT